MKNFLFFLLATTTLAFVSINSAYAQVNCAVCVENDWSPWSRHNEASLYVFDYAISVNSNSNPLDCYFLLKDSHYVGKEGKWKVYEATAYYYVNQHYPTMDPILRNYMFPALLERDPYNGSYNTRVTSKVKVKIRKTWLQYTINVFFGDGLAIAFSL